MSSQVVTFQQMAITFTVIPLSSVIGPMVAGGIIFSLLINKTLLVAPDKYFAMYLRIHR